MAGNVVYHNPLSKRSKTFMSRKKEKDAVHVEGVENHPSIKTSIVLRYLKTSYKFQIKCSITEKPTITIGHKCSSSEGSSQVDSWYCTSLPCLPKFVGLARARNWCIRCFRLLDPTWETMSSREAATQGKVTR
ncbi:hypothetical protein OUZ56_028041 [Daphnia magna]|uniref:Uncharacterized protein n=1 Tax=Daphnia magna TaxID=35525 RepID=A0ABR0B2P3_9CRUS|nr:hypothetical protein OUZ56_028041 [Daphnia magna]